LNKITDISQLDLSKQYSYADYLTWQFTDRVELLKGWVHKMSPAPLRMHQDISRRLVVLIANFIDEEKCKVYDAPFDVRLVKYKGVENKEINTVVQPDICVVCDESKLDDYGCVGAPDFIIEILSKSTMKKDEVDKFQLYEENGVKEYWIVDIFSKVIKVFLLDPKTNKYNLLNYFTEEDETIAVNTLKGLSIDLKHLFNNI
jgi:Uma2 family endonuclease